MEMLITSTIRDWAAECLNVLEGICDIACLDPLDLHVDPWAVFSLQPVEFAARTCGGEDLSTMLEKETAKELQSLLEQIKDYNSELQALHDLVHQMIGEKLETVQKTLQSGNRQFIHPSYTEQVICLLLLEASVPGRKLDLRSNITGILNFHLPDTFTNAEVDEVVNLFRSPRTQRILALRQSSCQLANALRGKLMRELDLH